MKTYQVSLITNMPKGFLESCKNSGIDPLTSTELGETYREEYGIYPKSYLEALGVLE